MANNQHVNKVIYGNQTLIDLSTDTLMSTDQLLRGVIAHDKTGAQIIGTGGTPAIAVTEEPDTGGGVIKNITALDISDTTAVASDVASGKYFYTAGGVKTAGTASGGGGGLEYETGTWEPSEDVIEGEVLFANSHSDPPIFFIMVDSASSASTTTWSNHGYVFAYHYKALGRTLYMNSSNIVHAAGIGAYRSNSGSDMQCAGLMYLGTQISTRVTNEAIYPRCNSSSYWRAGRTYMWIAVWAPTT